MCKRCITPSYDSLFAQKGTHLLAFEKFSLQSKVYQIGVIFSNSASCENGTSFNFLKIPTHLHFSLNYVCMHVVNGDGSFRQIHSKLTVLIRQVPLLAKHLLVTTSTNITMMAAAFPTKKNNHSRDSRPFTFYPHSYSSKPTKGKITFFYPKAKQQSGTQLLYYTHTMSIS